jgi:adenylylsulfate kinase-like enzyme/ubiquinone/menaquinone biosynthesis C-methylase UbiE
VSQTGAVVWITGYSGAGKTTAGKFVADALSRIGVSVFHFDGDEMRSVLGGKWGYTAAERQELAMVYARLASKMAENGVVVVCSVVAMFEGVREWNRKNCVNYLEIYLRVPVNILAERDTKGLYKKYLGTDNPESVLSAEFEVPTRPDLVIDNFGIVSPEHTAQIILEKYLLNLNARVLPARSTVDGAELRNSISSYWDSYYGKKKAAPATPTMFAQFCKDKFLEAGQVILEIGCGNGRDSFYFAEANPVIAIDASEVAVKINREIARDRSLENITFHTGFFGETAIPLNTPPDCIYSRFVLHAMDERTEDNIIGLSHRILAKNGLFLAEFRTLADPLSREGISIGENEKITDHYRRFIDANAVIAKLSAIGFEIIYSVESRGLAPHGSEDPVVARIAARRL